MKLSLEQRLIKYRHISETGCWEWAGSRGKDQYGRININGTPVLAHRAAAFVWKAFNWQGSVLHTCDNPPCINPDHLFIGTQKDNVKDCIAKGRFRTIGRKKQTHCKRGHALTEDNLYKSSRHRQCRICSLALSKKRYSKKN